MIRTDDIAGLVQAWMAEPVTMPTAAGIERVAQRVSVTRQRRGRLPTMARWPGRVAPAMVLVAVGAITVAGGLLIAGTTPPPTVTSTESLLERLETVAFEPGVRRVVADATGRSFEGVSFSDVTVAPDGTVWLARANGSSYLEGAGDGGVVEALVLGQPAIEARNFGPGYGIHMAAAADGRLLVATDGGELLLHQGTTWTTLAVPGSVRDVEVSADGSTWAAWLGGANPDNGRPDAGVRTADGGWAVIDSDDSPAEFVTWSLGFAVTPDGRAWMSVGFHHDGQGKNGMWRGLVVADDGGWRVEEPIPGRTDLDAGPIAAGSDGTLWVYLDGTASSTAERYLARLDGEGWTMFTTTDGVPRLVGTQSWDAKLGVDHEGRLWMADLWKDNIELPPGTGTHDRSCHGVLSFDGDVWHRYLKDVCVNRVAVAPDGAIWATAELGKLSSADGDVRVARLAGVYLIRPSTKGAS